MTRGGAALRSSTTLRATNVIAQGDDTSLNGATVVNGGGNTTEAPEFVADDSGDFRSEPTSTSTVDRGTAANVNGFGIGQEPQVREEEAEEVSRRAA